MAEALLKYIGEGVCEAQSAGTNPTAVRDEAITVLREAGIDISQSRSKLVDEFAGCEFDYVITVCNNARENCPYFPAKKELIHNPFNEPAIVTEDIEKRLQAFRKVRDEIKAFLLKFVENRYYSVLATLLKSSWF